MDIRKEQTKSGVILHITGVSELALADDLQLPERLPMFLVPRYDMSEGTNTWRDSLSQHKGTFTVKWEAL